MRGALLVALAVAAAATESQAQAPSPPTRAGWIGVEASLIMTTGERPVVVVRDVWLGSPAAQVGLAPGDTLIAVDGMPPTLVRFRALRTELRAGDPVELTVRRGRTERTVTVRAAPRPTGPDPMVVADAGRESPPLIPRAPVVVTGQAPGWTVALPASAFSDPRTDSLLVRLRERERQLVQVQRAEVERLRVLAPRLEAERLSPPDDRELRDQRSRRERLTSEIFELRVAIERWAEAMAAEVERTASAAWITPYLARQDRVAGARIIRLNPALAEYFGTARGLLVVEVVPGTPAAGGGLRPGDVLLRVGETPVDNLSSLRLAVASAAPQRALQVTLVRRGSELRLELPR